MSAAERALALELNRRCHCVGTDLPALRSWLDKDLRARGLSEPIVASHPHLFSASPVFMTCEDAAQMQQSIRAIESVIALPAYRNNVLAGAPDIAQRPQLPRSVFLGYDFHLTPTGPKLIEINTNAGGAMLNVAMMRAQQACCLEVMDYLAHQPSATQLEDVFFRTFLEEWRIVRGNQALKCIAIVDDSPETQYLYPEFLLFTQLFESHGIRAVISSADQLRYDRGALWLGEQRIDLVYNRLTDFYLQAPEHAVLAQAYAENAVVVTPHPQSHALYANKHNLNLLSDEQTLIALGVGNDTREILLRTIPRTESLSTKTESQWWNERKRWFFKPASGFGSRGSYRGDKLTRKAFVELTQGDYVAQALTLPSERWIAQDATSPLKFDVRNYVYESKVQLLAGRLYQGQTTNFRTEGGGFAPVYMGRQVSRITQTPPLAESSRPLPDDRMRH